jgi:tetratricopeptide (TPR) repeat protein
MKTIAILSPFPGLRPFEPDEDHLFFGREREIDELLRRLRQTRFLPVIGASGSGKSSLVCSGLIPSLHSGFMVSAGSSWRVAVLRPGEDPIGHLAASLSAPQVLGDNTELAATSPVLIDATLRRSTLGLAEAVRLAKVPPHDNLVVVVDQFEEIFRFRRSRTTSGSPADTEFFVKLLLEAARQSDVPIYIVLTMRADFIGDCLEHPGLPEAINAGQYLVPRMTRGEMRSAITGPIAVAGGQISDRLVLRLLNDAGDDPDQLPVLQHALMRTWDYWTQHRQPGEPIDTRHYEAVGTMQRALSIHADEAYEETGSERLKEITSRMFKALTDTSTDSRGVRRPTSVRELAAICGSDESEVLPAVEVFRRPGRSFLVPFVTVVLESTSIIDISHESLMRCWTRLIRWAEEERISATTYERLAQAAAWCEEGTAGLWRDPELELGLAWRKQNHPTAAWAKRYDPAFERAIGFLDRSEAERNRLQAQAERERRKKLKLYAWFSGVLALSLIISLILGWMASRQRDRAELNLQLAKRAVDETLSSAGSGSARVAADSPQMEQFRRELLQKAEAFYTEFSRQKPRNEAFQAEIALAHFHLADIHRLLQESSPAIDEYNTAASQFEALAGQYPNKPDYRQLLANTYNWLGETQRVLGSADQGAEKAYDSALGLQEDLHRQFPNNTAYQQELARTHYNRGILRSDHGLSDDSDFRKSIELLRPLAEMKTSNTAQVQQELARTYNNLARMLRINGQTQEAQGLYEQAIRIHESITKEDPGNQEYKLELATFYNNLAVLLEENGQLDLASQMNRQAIEKFELLAEPVPSLSLEIAHAHVLRGRIFESQRSETEADREYAQSIDMFQRLDGRINSTDFHLKYGDALFSLGALRRDKKQLRGAADLLSRAVTQHLSTNSSTNLGYDYLLLALVQLDLREMTEARIAAENLSRLIPSLTEPDKSTLDKQYTSLRDRLK